MNTQPSQPQIKFPISPYDVFRIATEKLRDELIDPRREFFIGLRDGQSNNPEWFKKFAGTISKAAYDGDVSFFRYLSKMIAPNGDNKKIISDHMSCLGKVGGRVSMTTEQRRKNGKKFAKRNWKLRRQKYGPSGRRSVKA